MYKPRRKQCNGELKHGATNRQVGERFNFMQMSYGTLGDTSRETTALVLIPTEDTCTEVPCRPIKAEYVNKTLGANQSAWRLQKQRETACLFVSVRVNALTSYGIKCLSMWEVYCITYFSVVAQSHKRAKCSKVTNYNAKQLTTSLKEKQFNVSINIVLRGLLMSTTVVSVCAPF